jgi:hypothetical protein
MDQRYLKFLMRPLAVTLTLLSLTGTPLLAQGQPDATAAANRAAIEQFYPVMVEKLGQNDFNGARELCHLAIKWEPNEPAHFYNLACIEARAGNLNMGLAALTKAADLGYAGADVMAADPDLASLRTSPIYFEQYQKVLTNAGAAAGATQAAPPQYTPPPAPAPAPAAPVRLAREVQPAPHKVTAKGPVGLYIMTRYWIATRSLETASWYFSPEGYAYENPAGGFSPEELAKTKVQAKLSGGGDTLTFTWSDGKSTTGNYEPNPAQKAFYWDMGNFVAAKGFDDPSALVGQWSGGMSISGAIVAKTLTLNADGSYTLSAAGSITSTTDGSSVRAGSSGTTGGSWQAGQYSLTLNASDGTAERSIAFPFNVGEETGPLQKFYFQGIMWSRM